MCIQIYINYSFYVLLNKTNRSVQKYHHAIGPIMLHI